MVFALSHLFNSNGDLNSPDQDSQGYVTTPAAPYMLAIRNSDDKPVVHNPLIGGPYKGIITFTRAIWPLIQRPTFGLNPFDCLNDIDGAQFKSYINPFEFLSYFGYVGMRASDYHEDAYNKASIIEQEGVKYIIDPYLAESTLYE